MKINPINCPNCNYILENHNCSDNIIACHNTYSKCKYAIRYYLDNKIEIFIYSKEYLLKFIYMFSNLTLEIYMNYELISAIENYAVDNDLTNIFNLFKKYESNLLFL